MLFLIIPTNDNAYIKYFLNLIAFFFAIFGLLVIAPIILLKLNLIQYDK